MRYAIKTRRYILAGKLEEFDPQIYVLGKEDETTTRGINV